MRPRATLIPLAVRFWSKVARRAPHECWEWTAGRLMDGYGKFSVDRKNALSHRVAYELTHGAIPKGLLVLHRCNHPPCVNPEHLYIGDGHDNWQDLKRSGWVHPNRGRPRKMA